LKKKEKEDSAPKSKSNGKLVAKNQIAPKITKKVQNQKKKKFTLDSESEEEEEEDSQSEDESESLPKSRTMRNRAPTKYQSSEEDLSSEFSEIDSVSESESESEYLN